MLDLLKSKDASLLEANQWMFDGQSRFLDGKENLSGRQHANHILLTSYPRSGNAFTRRTLESLTGVASGATFSLSFGFSQQWHGFKGEGYLDDQVWFARSHHPMISPLA